MIKSMTGYGKAVSEMNGKKITVEIKSLNSKQMDIHMRIANQYKDKEIEMRNMVSQQLKRGKIDFALTVEDENAVVKTKINVKMAGVYLDELDRLGKFDLPVPKDVKDIYSILMRLPNIWIEEEVEEDENSWAIVKQTVENALAEIDQYRAHEGVGLRTLFEEKINNISNLLQKTVPFEKERIERLRNRLNENLQQINSNIDIDSNRLEQEMIFYIEKLDVNEEKQRLTNHLNYFTTTMNSEENAGKKLGFILQEIGREINTLGSKANHSEMQKIVVMMKDELEQMKEQILNTL